MRRFVGAVVSKSNRRKREFQREHATAGYHPENPLLYTPAPVWTYMAPVLTMPGKPPHRICKGKP